MFLKVMIFRTTVANERSSPTFALHKVAEWNHNYYVCSLVSRGNTLMLGDAISSVSFLELVGTQLKVVAKDYGPLWPLCVEAWGDKSIIGANVSRLPLAGCTCTDKFDSVIITFSPSHWSNRSWKRY